MKKENCFGKRGVIILLYILSFTVSIAPVCTYLALNKDRYISDAYDGIKLTAGAVVALFIVALKVAGKLRVPSRTTFFVLVFVLGYLLEPIIKDICVLSFLALCGEAADFAVTIPLKRLQLSQKTDMTARKTAEKVEKIIDKYYREGRNDDRF